MMNLKAPENVILKPTITVFGVGGAGGNAVNNMIESGLQGVVFAVANTDAQALEHSKAQHKIQLGAATTRGLGAGAEREVGRAAAEESRDEILGHLEGSNMVFITAGMGGGTGTGAAPVIARLAKELGILTVGVVTKPFHFEGAHRMETADAGLFEMQQHVDTLIVIPNQNLFRIANERTTFTEAFKVADEVLKKGVQSITDLMIMPGLINLDFADVRAVMREMGKAMMGTGEASGEDRAIRAAEAAISNPLLDQSSMRGAKGVLINISGGDMTLFEVDEAANRIRKEIGETQGAKKTRIIFGATFTPELEEGVMRVSVVATGIDADEMAMNFAPIESEELLEEEVVLAEVEEGLDQEPVMPEAEVEDFEEYDIGASEAPTPPVHIMPEAPEPKKTEATKSLLGRMWESIKGAEPHVQENRKEPTAAQGSFESVGSSDIYDVPAFLRRKK
jgi:cell division protein FtsZ